MYQMLYWYLYCIYSGLYIGQTQYVVYFMLYRVKYMEYIITIHYTRKNTHDGVQMSNEIIGIITGLSIDI